nr:retrotransposon protein, putative, unclassified [Tanacetum cinerariifolium]
MEFERACEIVDKGHVISAQGVAIYPTKVQAMQSWTIPKNVKQLRGFLAHHAFVLLKEAMIKASVLGLPDFNKPFIVETDDLGVAQMKWLPKLMDFDYEVAYKKGKENIVADAFSRRE